MQESLNILECEITLKIEDCFSTTHSYMNDIYDLNAEIKQLVYKRNALRTDLYNQFITLLCLVTTNSRVFNGNRHKVSLIKLHRAVTDTGLKESKELLEIFIDPDRSNNNVLR